MLFIHSSVYEHLGCFHFLAFMSNAAITFCLQGVVLRYVFICLGYIPRNGITGSCGSTMFNHLRNCWTVFLFSKAAVFLCSHQQHVRIFNFCTSYSILIIVFFLIMAILVGVKWYLIVHLHFKKKYF